MPDLPPVSVRFSSPPEERRTLILSGSAGEGIQQAAEILARAAMAAGLHVTKKGSYPVTVGVGFSTAEVILSRSSISYHGVHEPDAVIITSMDGLQNQEDRIRRMRRGMLWIDASLPVPETGAEIQIRDFRGRGGGACGPLRHMGGPSGDGDPASHRILGSGAGKSPSRPGPSGSLRLPRIIGQGDGAGRPLSRTTRL